MRDDSTWNRLTSGQLEQLDEWLFEERLGYADALARAEKEFGLTASLSSMGRYYRRRAKERQMLGLIAAQRQAWELNDLAVKTDDLRTAAVKLVAKATLDLAVEQPEQVEQLASLTKLLLWSEDNDLRRSRLKLAQQYFDYEATAASLTELPQLRAYLKVVGDDASLSHDEKIKRVQAILFGWDRSKSAANGQATSTSGN